MTTAPPIRNNSRMGQARPDIACEGPLRDAILPLLERFPSGSAFQSGVIDVLRRLGDGAGTADAAARALETGSDVVLWREDLGGRDVTVSVLYLAPGEVHPPHHHHNVTSVQIVLDGEVHGREYERVRRLDEETVLLRPLFDGCLPPGSLLLAQEWARNAHWFAAGHAGPALIWNCNARGFEDRTFDPSDGRPLGRRLLHPSETAYEGGISAREIDVEEAYRTFGAVSPADWPLPVMPLETGGPNIVETID